MTSHIYHGGDLGQARQQFGDPLNGWLDLSTGINPVPYPVDGLTSNDWTRLPAREAESMLEAIASRAFGLAHTSQLLATPGTQAVIQALPWLVPAKQVAILGFTYQEHTAQWQASGAEVRTIVSLADTANAEVVIVVNPNNPDGRLISPDNLLAASECLTRRGGILVVDEAFMDVLSPDASLLPLLPKAGVVVLRSFGKTWGLAGLRLGFVAGPDVLIERMRAFFGRWAVSGPALTLGARAIADRNWLHATIARLDADCHALDAILMRAGLDVIGGTPLFRLTRYQDSAGIFARLGRAGILVRPFPDRPEWLRFGIPATHADRARLSEALLS